MTKFFAVTKTGLCPDPRDFSRHGNIPKKSEKEKAEAKRSDFFGLLLEGTSINAFFDRNLVCFYLKIFK